MAGLAGCAQLVPQTMALRSAWPADAPSQVELTELPFFPQVEYQCGPAALATVLGAAGLSLRPEDLVEQVYLPARQGSLQLEMLVAPRRHDLVSYQLAPQYGAVLRELAAGNPVLVLQDNGLFPLTQWHYAVVAGYDYEKGDLWLRSGETRRLTLSFTQFEFSWKRSGYWAMVALPPQRIPASATETSYLPAVLALDRVGSSAAAKLAYQTFLQRWPGNELASIGLANRHYADAALADAEAVLRAALAAQPASPALLNNLAQVLSDQGLHSEALALIDRAAANAGALRASVQKTRELIAGRANQGQR